MTDHPTITPPPELVQKWFDQAELATNRIHCIATRAAQWGADQFRNLPTRFYGVPLIPPLDCVDPQSWIAQRIYDMGYDQRGEVNEAQLQQARDQELKECCEWLKRKGWEYIPDALRSARRPKPPSLKERAWKLLECYGTSGVKLTADQCNTIREALEDSNG